MNTTVVCCYTPVYNQIFVKCFAIIFNFTAEQDNRLNFKTTTHRNHARCLSSAISPPLISWGEFPLTDSSQSQIPNTRFIQQPNEKGRDPSCISAAESSHERRIIRCAHSSDVLQFTHIAPHSCVCTLTNSWPQKHGAIIMYALGHTKHIIYVCKVKRLTQIALNYSLRFLENGRE